MTELGADLQPGARVGEYVVDGKIGEGGMGTVYAGHQPVIGKRVAIKVLSPQCAAVPDLVRRFVEEARAVNRIGHPNIIDIFSFGALDDARPYFVMEFLDGASLAARMAAGTLAPDETRRLLRQVCGALEAAHRAGIVHRDLKPENIWVATPRDESSYVKVLDFGIAKLVDDHQAAPTRTGAAMGTPRYMAPEQCLGRAVDRRADIYAFGVMLYEMFTGNVPFRGETVGDLIYQHVSEKPVLPSRQRPMGAALEALILDCLQKQPADRPGSAREVSGRLDLALAADTESPAAASVQDRRIAQVGPASTTLGQSAGQADPIIPVASPTAGRRWRSIAALVGVAALAALALTVSRARQAVVVPPATPAATAPLAAVPAAPPGDASGGELRLRIANGRADRIALDGREIGRNTAEATVPRVPLGAHTVTIHAAGRAVETRTIAIAEGKVLELAIELASIERPRAERRAATTRAVASPGKIPEETPKPTRAQERGLIDENPLRDE